MPSQTCRFRSIPTHRGLLPSSLVRDVRASLLFVHKLKEKRFYLHFYCGPPHVGRGTS